MKGTQHPGEFAQERGGLLLMWFSSTITKCLRKITAVTEGGGNKSKRSRGKVHTDFANANEKSEGKLI